MILLALSLCNMTAIAFILYFTLRDSKRIDEIEKENNCLRNEIFANYKGLREWVIQELNTKKCNKPSNSSIVSNAQSYYKPMQVAKKLKVCRATVDLWRQQGYLKAAVIEKTKSGAVRTYFAKDYIDNFDYVALKKKLRSNITGSRAIKK